MATSHPHSYLWVGTTAYYQQRFNATMKQNGDHADRTCRGTTKAGTPCQAPGVLVGDDGYCDGHRPGYRAEMRRRGVKGGHATRKKRKPRPPGMDAEELGSLQTSADAMRWCRAIARALAEGRISAARGNALRGCVREWRKVHESHLEEQVVAELKQKVEALEGRGVI